MVQTMIYHFIIKELAKELKKKLLVKEKTLKII